MAENDNPYRVPSAPVADIRTAEGATAFGLPAAVVDAGRGASWISEGWALFKAAPVMWIVALILLVAIQMALEKLPLLGDIVAILLGPLYAVGTLAFAHGIARGEPAELGNLFAGFRGKFGPLVAVAVIYVALMLAAVLVFTVVAAVLLGSSTLFSVVSAQAVVGQIFAGAGGLIILVLLLALVGVMTLIAAAYWYAPGLVFYANLDPWSAMQASYSACLRNWLPLLVYGLLGLLVALGGVLALGIGLLVALPVLMASYYASFRDLFGRKA